MSTPAERPEAENSAVLQTVHSYTRELDPALRALRRVSLFADLPDEVLANLSSNAAVRRFRQGETIVRQGEESHSLLVVASGVVEVLLDTRGGDSVRLHEFHAGDYFGEMSLLDGRPRSANAIALTDCQILELDREAVLSQTTPLTRKLLVELAMRVRRTDNTVTDLTDKVSRAAYANVHAAVSVELETIKTLYQRTEHRSNHALEQARERATAACEHADRVAASVQSRIDAGLALLKKRIAPVLTAALALLGVLGVHSYLDLQAKYKEALGWHEALGKFQTRMHAADKSLRVISETMTSLRSTREAAGLHAPVETPAELRRAALDFETAKAELYHRYIAAPDQGTRYETFDPEVVYEAIDTFATLAAWGRMDGQPALRHAERRQLLDALGFVVRSLSDVSDSESRGSQSLLDRKLRDTFYLLAEPTAGRERQRLLDSLERIIERPASARARDNAALIAASLHHKTPVTRDALASMLTDARPWRAASGALALAKLRDQAGWKHIKRALGDPATRYMVAASLAQEGQAPLRQLARSFGDAASLPKLIEQVRRAIEAHRPRNCYEQRFDRWLTMCLDGHCGRGDGAIGGECTLNGS